MGGGLTLALNCDIRLSVPDTRFAYPVLRNNILPGQYDVDILNSLIGRGRTSIILLSGQTIELNEALDWGLIDRKVQRSNLTKESEELLAAVQTSDRYHQMNIKKRIRGA